MKPLSILAIPRASAQVARHHVGKVAADLASGTGQSKRTGKTSERLSGKFSEDARSV
jgi:hypothetical protein